MTRSDIEKYLGWTLDAVGGDLTDATENEIRPSALRLQFRSPQGQYANVFVEAQGPPDEEIHLCFWERPGRAPFQGATLVEQKPASTVEEKTPDGIITRVVA